MENQIRIVTTAVLTEREFFTSPEEGWHVVEAVWDRTDKVWRVCMARSLGYQTKFFKERQEEQNTRSVES